jgi:AbrB family looped-hinge helix DNA binding protein
MEKLITSMDQHGRMLVPVEIRERLNIKPGDKVNLEIYDDEVKIINADKIIDQMHEIFIKNQTDKISGAVDDFISRKQEEYKIEEARSKKNGE